MGWPLRMRKGRLECSDLRGPGTASLLCSRRDGSGFYHRSRERRLQPSQLRQPGCSSEYTIVCHCVCVCGLVVTELLAPPLHSAPPWQQQPGVASPPAGAGSTPATELMEYSSTRWLLHTHPGAGRHSQLLPGLPHTLHGCFASPPSPRPRRSAHLRLLRVRAATTPATASSLLTPCTAVTAATTAQPHPPQDLARPVALIANPRDEGCISERKRVDHEELVADRDLHQRGWVGGGWWWW